MSCLEKINKELWMISKDCGRKEKNKLKE